MLLDCLLTVTPVCVTGSGSCGSANDTRFCTSTAAMSESRDGSNVTVIVLVPLLLLLEVMYLMPSTPLICRSKIVVTVFSTTSALAPT